MNRSRIHGTYLVVTFDFSPVSGIYDTADGLANTGVRFTRAKVYTSAGIQRFHGSTNVEFSMSPNRVTMISA